MKHNPAVKRTAQSCALGSLRAARSGVAYFHVSHLKIARFLHQQKCEEFMSALDAYRSLTNLLSNRSGLKSQTASHYSGNFGFNSLSISTAHHTGGEDSRKRMSIEAHEALHAVQAFTQHPARELFRAILQINRFRFLFLGMLLQNGIRMKVGETIFEAASRGIPKHFTPADRQIEDACNTVLSCHEPRFGVSVMNLIEGSALAVLMLGVEPFFTAFSGLATVEDTLAAYPKALVVVLKLIARARRAAMFAREFATMRRDHDVQEITVATLLHETTEIVCVHAPTLTLDAIGRRRTEPARPAAAVQREVFGVSAAELQHALISAWRLPGLLAGLLDSSHADNPRVRTITLATRFARHQARGWSSPALASDLTELEELLHQPRETLLQRAELAMPGPLWCSATHMRV